jgi:hypothetical protein
MRPLILRLCFLIASTVSCAAAQQPATAPTATRTKAEQEILTLSKDKWRWIHDRRLSQLFRIGRTSLVIGVVAVAVALLIGSIVENALGGSHFASLIRESFSIGGWVAMWRPLEIFLYDWWPIQAERKLYNRLGAMPVRIQVKTA